MKDKAIKDALLLHRVRSWELADKLGIHEATLCRRLRYTLADDVRAEYIKAVEEIAAERKERTT